MASPFFERLRADLAPDYELVRELASGGMGTVCLARDVALDCLVAVKVLRPEFYTVDTAARFEREAQILAKLRHSNIVVVHKVDPRHGLHFYVMEYLEGETLQARLATRGRLPQRDALKLGRDLLEALEVAHRAGVIHRDVKPSNVFWNGRHAVLTDFGIAKQVTREALTDPHFRVGTAPYMAPELFSGIEANESTDLYAAAMVIYEAFTGRRWAKEPPAKADWSGIPHRVMRVLARALELDPKDRWPDAATFRRRLWRTRVWPYRRNAIGIALGFTALGMLVRPTAPSTTLHLSLEAAPAAPDLPAWLGDSVTCGLAQRLSAYPELAARCTSRLEQLASRWARRLVVRVAIENDAGRARVHLTSTLKGISDLGARGLATEWPALVDSLADSVAAVLYGAAKLLDPSLPLLVLPKTPAGRLALLGAERAFARGTWGEARAGYAAAATLDPTCWICYWRHAEVGRWFDLADDPRDSAHYHAHVADFPVYYQTLIRAERLPLRARLDSLQALRRDWKDFLFGAFRLGDELLHRGPLVGRARREAAPPLEAILKLVPAFVPALQHLAWLRIAEGDSGPAALALGRAEQAGNPGDPASFATLALLQVAYAWRFFGREAAMRRTEAVAAGARAAGIRDLDAGARYLAGFGSPEGQLAFAERLLREPRFERSAGVARALALVGLGRPDSGLALARGLAGRFSELAPFATALTWATLSFDRDAASVAARWPDLRASLVRDSASPGARWMLGMMSATSAPRLDPLPEGVAPIVDVVAPTLDPRAAPEAALLFATAIAGQGDARLALESTDRLTELTASGRDDAFLRAALHLARAEWFERTGRPAQAGEELRWPENSDLIGYPTRAPQPAEVDWAFAPLAAWRRASLLRRNEGKGDDLCRAYGRVARSWAAGEPRYHARADSAVHRLRALACRGAP